MKINPKIIEILGWFGAISILTAYGLNLFSILSPQSLNYIILNAMGGFLVGLNALAKKDHPSVLIEWAWVLLSLIALVKAIF